MVFSRRTALVKRFTYLIANGVVNIPVVPGDFRGEGKVFMTISIPPEDMVPQGRYIAEQKEKVVLEYYSVKHGPRRKYLESIGVSYSSFKRWRKQFAGGSGSTESGRVWEQSSILMTTL